MKFNSKALIALCKENVGCAWIVYQLNTGINIFFSECKEEKRKNIQILIDDQILSLNGDRVVFSKMLENFAKTQPAILLESI